MTGFPDYYSMLGIDPSADPEVITAAYRALAKKYHPDTGATAGTASAERFEQVQQAYEVLRTPESRRRYDEELLAATERELDQHLAARQRMLAAGIGSGGLPPPPPLPGIGSIRPEPLGGPSSRPAVAETRRRSVLPFLVPGILALAVVAGGSFLLLSKPPEKPSVAVVTPAPAPPPQPAATPAAPAPATAIVSVTPPPSTVKPAPAPVFGSSMETAAAAKPPEAPAPQVSAPVKAATETSAVTKPPKAVAPEVTASLTPEPAEAPSITPLPTPKPKPKQAAKPAPKVVQEKPIVRREPVREPEPQPVDEDPPQFVPVAGPHKLVIFERQPGARATAWNVGVFKNARRCSRFGVKAIMHRMNETGRETPGEIWYQCQPV